MALPAAVDGCGGDTHWERLGDHAFVAFNDLSEHIVERAEDESSLGVTGGLELGHLVLVTPSTVTRADDDGNGLAVMVEGVDVAFLRRVAFKTADVGAEVQTVAPLRIDRWVLLLMALDARLRRCTDGRQAKGASCTPSAVRGAGSRIPGPG